MFIHTQRESKTKLKSTIGTSTVFPGVHFSALHPGKCPTIVPWRFLLASSRTALEHMQWSVFPVCAAFSASAGNLFTTALLCIGDKILSLVPLSLDVYLMLQQQREKCSSDYLCLVVSVVTQHVLLPIWLEFWRYRLSNVTFNIVPNWQRWGPVIIISFATNGAETDVGYAWLKASLVQFTVCKRLHWLDQQGRWDYTVIL